MIDGALGELSLFHETHGFYVHGVSIESATLPCGWEERTIPVQHAQATRGNVGHCLESHDLAVSKLVAYRDKDRDFVRTLLVEELVNVDVLRERIASLLVSDETKQRLTEWVRVTANDL